MNHKIANTSLLTIGQRDALAHHIRTVRNSRRVLADIDRAIQRLAAERRVLADAAYSLDEDRRFEAAQINESNRYVYDVEQFLLKLAIDESRRRAASVQVH